MEIVEVDAAISTIPVVTFHTIQDTLLHIRGKNMVKGVEQMVKIHNELLDLEAQIDQELLDAVLMQNSQKRLKVKNNCKS